MKEAPVANRPSPGARHRAAGWSGMSAAVWTLLVVVLAALIGAAALFVF